MKGLIIKEPWIDMILNGEKTWEIRGSDTRHRGRTELIKSGTGLIYGSGDLIGTIQLFNWEHPHYRDRHKIPSGYKMPYKRIWAWMFENVSWHPEPIPYKHPQGAVIWVNL